MTLNSSFLKRETAGRPVTTFSLQGAGRVDRIQNSGAERFDSHANSITWPQQHWTLMRVMR